MFLGQWRARQRATSTAAVDGARTVCTLLIFPATGSERPCALGFNRDEYSRRGASQPGRYWNNQAIFGGLDRCLGGSWLAVNTQRRELATVINPRRTMGPWPGKLSRGTLVISLLDRDASVPVQRFLDRLPVEYYAPFLLIYISRLYKVVVFGDGQQLRRIPVEWRQPVLVSSDGINRKHQCMRSGMQAVFGLAWDSSDWGSAEFSYLKRFCSQHGDGTVDGLSVVCKHTVTPARVCTVSSDIVVTDFDRDMRWWHCTGNPCEQDYKAMLV